MVWVKIVGNWKSIKIEGNTDKSSKDFFDSAFWFKVQKILKVYAAKISIPESPNRASRLPIHP